MRLILEVVGEEAAKLNTPLRREFRETGGTIGRLASNDWVLPNNRLVSGRHAKIVWVSGAFYIEDTSTNGVFVDDVAVGQGNRALLTDGTTVRIDPFQIRVAVVADSLVPDVPYRTPAADSGAGDISLESLLGPTPKPVPSGPPSARAFGGGSPADVPYKPPAPIAPVVPTTGQLLEDNDYDPFNDRGSAAVPAVDPVPSPAPTPAPRPPVPSAPDIAIPNRPPDVSSGSSQPPAPASGARAGGDVTLAAVLEGAGLTGVTVTPELAQDFGLILRLVVSGMMDVLQARQRIKDEFGLPHTVYRPLGNNPLKFSADVDDALHKLLIHRHKAYLSPVEAFDDAFDDIRNHEVAMLAGVRVAFRAMLERFNPVRLQELFERDAKKGALISVGTKLKYWDRYCEMVRDMVSDADDSFRTLFGDEFARAYEEQLGRLKGKGRREPPDEG